MRIIKLQEFAFHKILWIHISCDGNLSIFRQNCLQNQVKNSLHHLLVITAVNQTTLDAVLTLFSELDGTGILEHVASVNVEKEYDMVVQYDDRYEIDLGSSDRLAYKVQYLQAILEQLSDFQAGTIDLTLSEANRAKFHPKA